MSFNSFIADDISNSEFCFMFDKEHFRRIGKVSKDELGKIKISDKHGEISINHDDVKPIKAFSHLITYPLDNHLCSYPSYAVYICKRINGDRVAGIYSPIDNHFHDIINNDIVSLYRIEKYGWGYYYTIGTADCTIKDVRYYLTYYGKSDLILSYEDGKVTSQIVNSLETFDGNYTRMHLEYAIADSKDVRDRLYYIDYDDYSYLIGGFTLIYSHDRNTFTISGEKYLISGEPMGVDALAYPQYRVYEIKDMTIESYIEAISKLRGDDDNIMPKTKLLVAYRNRYGNLNISIEDEVPSEKEFISVRAIPVNADSDDFKTVEGVVNKLYCFADTDHDRLLVACMYSKSTKTICGRKFTLEGEDLGEGRFTFDDNNFIYEIDIPKSDVSRLKRWKLMLSDLISGDTSLTNNITNNIDITIGSLVVGVNITGNTVVGRVTDFGMKPDRSYVFLDGLVKPIPLSLITSLDRYTRLVDVESIKRTDIVYGFDTLWTDITITEKIGGGYTYRGIDIKTGDFKFKSSKNRLPNKIVRLEGITIPEIAYIIESIRNKVGVPIINKSSDITNYKEENNMERTIKSIETKEGFRYVRGSKKKEKITTITTIITFEDDVTSSATCDKSEFNARQGALEAAVKVGCSNFNRAYEKYIKAEERKKRAEYKESCRCGFCHKPYNSPDDARACEQKHKDSRAKKKEAYKARKEERYILEVAKSRLECEKRERKINEVMNKLAFNECDEALIKDINTRLNTDKLTDYSIDGLTEE